MSSLFRDVKNLDGHEYVTRDVQPQAMDITAKLGRPRKDSGQEESPKKVVKKPAKPRQRRKKSVTAKPTPSVAPTVAVNLDPKWENMNHCQMLETGHQVRSLQHYDDEGLPLSPCGANHRSCGRP